MDTRTGEIVGLGDEQARTAELQWGLWEAGLLPEQPRFAPINKDRVVVSKAKKRIRKGAMRRRRVKATRSYKDYCR